MQPVDFQTRSEGQHFTRSGKIITWSPAGQFDLVVGKYKVIAIYHTLET